MKWFTTIIALYLVALSCLPCSDMEISRLEFSHTKASSDYDGDSHEQNKDMCSPFCICNCCGLQFLSFQPINTYDVPVISTIIKIALPSYKSVLASSFFGSIWQPPQLV